MASTLVRSALLCFGIYMLLQAKFKQANAQCDSDKACCFTEGGDEKDTINIALSEEEKPGPTNFTFNVEPPGSKAELNCPSIIDTTHPCYYLEVNDNNELVYHTKFDIELDAIKNSVTVSGDDVMLYTFSGVTPPLLKCTAPDSQTADTKSFVFFSNVNEAAEIAPSYRTSVWEHTRPGSELYFNPSIVALDPDVLPTENTYGDFSCQIVDKCVQSPTGYPTQAIAVNFNFQDAPFSVECKTRYLNATLQAEVEATILVASLLDYESGITSYDLTLQITDTAKDTPISVYTTLYITVDDLDDMDPKFNYTAYQATITEGDIGPLTTVDPAAINAVDQDTTIGVGEEIVYSFENTDEYLSINSSTGVVTVDIAFDYETVGQSYSVNVVATQAINTARSTTVPLTITITDIDDNCPYFESPTYNGQVAADDYYVVDPTSGDRLIIYAIDKDSEFIGGNYTLLPADGVFGLVDDNPGEVFIQLLEPQNLKADGTPHILTVSVDDVCANKTNITVEVSSRNPEFIGDPYMESVVERAEVGTPVLTVTATNSVGTDEGIAYRITSVTNEFTIDEQTGNITVSGIIDYEVNTDFTLVVEALDRRSDPIRSTSTSVTIYVNDTNDNCPVFSPLDTYNGLVSSQDKYVVDKSLMRLMLTATDADQTFTAEATVTDDNTGAGFGVESGVDNGVDVYFVTVQDFNKLAPGGSYVIEVTITDPDQVCSSSVEITINATDLSPKFDPAEYSQSIPEGSVVGTPVTTVSAKTYDGTPNVVYSIVSSSDDGLSKFEINEISGEITVKEEPIDAESVDLYTLVVEAQDRRLDPIRSTTATVFIGIIDINDECPEFVNTSLAGLISSHDVYVVTPDDSNRLILPAKDNDIDDFVGTASVEDSTGAVFTVEIAPSSVGNIRDYYIKVGDFSKLDVNIIYTIQVLLTDGSCVSNATITINATDLSPKFVKEEYSASIEEGSLVRAPVLKVSAQTFDGTDDLIYSIISSSDDGLSKFEINETSGEITVKEEPIDAESVDLYTLVVEAQDRRLDPIRSTTATVFIDIIDINDECPEFVNTSLAGLISSHDAYVVTPDDSNRLILPAKDNDIGDFVGTASVEDNTGAVFTVEIAPGSVGNIRDYYIKVGDFSKLDVNIIYTIQVLLTDGSCVSNASITINATDLSPKFVEEEYSASIEEGSLVRAPVLKVSAQTFDGTDDLIYSIISSSDDGLSKFEINETSGEITVKEEPIDAESVDLYTLVVEAQDRRLDPIRSTTATVFIHIIDINDECPEFVNTSLAGLISSHDAYVVTPDDSNRLILPAKDNDIGDFVGTASVEDNTGAGFTVEIAPSSVGNIRDYYIKVGDFSKLDVNIIYTIQVLLTDGSCVSNASITINATDLSPKFVEEEYSASIEEGSLVGATVLKVSAQTFDGTDDLIYSIISSSDDGLSKFEINETSGEITVKEEPIDAESVDLYTLVVEAQDRRLDPIRSTTATVFIDIIDINDECPEFVNTSLAGLISSHDAYVVTPDDSNRLILPAKDNDIGDFVGTASVEDNTGAGFTVEIAPSSVGNIRDYYIKVGDFSKLDVNIIYTIQVLLTDGSCVSNASITINATDLSPKFVEEEYSASIEEGSLVGATVLKVSAQTFDGTDDLIYSIISSSDDGLSKFEINETSGEITVKEEPIDAESVDLYTLVVEAQDRRLDPIRSTTATVFIDIIDINDECPEFVNTSLAGLISSHDAYVVTPDDSNRLILPAKDNDIGDFVGTASVEDNTGAGFTVEIAPSSVGNIRDYYIKVGDFSKLDVNIIYTIQVLLTDGSCVSNASITINATDLSPKFVEEEYSASIEEGSLVGATVLKVSAQTFDGTDDLIYSIISSSDDGLSKFEINETSGEITVKEEPIDAESVDLYTLVVEAQDRRLDPIRSTTATVFIGIIDINDECSEFVNTTFTGVISSQDVYVVTTEDSKKLILHAADTDASFEGSVDVMDTSGAGFEVELAPSSGGNQRDYYVKVNDFAQLEFGVTYVIEISLSDSGCVGSIATVNITAMDLSPVFDSADYFSEIMEGAEIGTFVEQVSALNFEYTEEGIVYSITSGTDDGLDLFTINSTSGGITTMSNSSDAELIGEYTLIVEAQDRRLDPIRSTTATVFIGIIDINDECPEFVNTSLAGLISSHDVYVVTPDDSNRLILPAIDNDIGDFVGTASVEDNTGAGFTVEIAPSSVGNIRDYYIKVDDFSKLDVNAAYTIQVLLTDASCISSANITINATDLSPTFVEEEYSTSIEEGSLVGAPVLKVSAQTFDGTDDLIYSIVSSSDDGLSKFEINETSGEITVKEEPIDAESVDLYTLVVEAQDRRLDPIRSTTATVFIGIIDINDECPEFVNTSLAGVISSQDVYVVTTEDDKKLVLHAADTDASFEGSVDVTDTSGAGFEVELAPSSGGNQRDYYVKVNDFAQLEFGVTYMIEISLSDSGCVGSIATVNITAMDLSPVFDSADYFSEIMEGAEIGTFVEQVSALNFEYTEEGVVYSITSGTDNGLDLFTINSTSGVITTVSNSSDAELIGEYTLIVEAQDRRLDPIRSSTASVIVTVTDANDNCPSFERQVYYGNITRQDVFVVDDSLEQLVVIAQDPDTEFIGTESLSRNPSFELFKTTPPSELSSLYLSIKLVNQSGIQDGAVYTLQISVVDGSCPSNMTDVIVTVSDSLAPVFSPPDYQASIMEGDSVDTIVTQVYAYRQDGTSINIFYRLQSANNDGTNIFTIDSASGVISLQSDTTNAESVTEYTLVVEAEDRLANPPRASTTTVIVQVNNTNDNCPVFAVQTYQGVITKQDKYVVIGEDNLNRLTLIPTDDDIDGFDGTVDQLNLKSIFSLDQTFSSDGDTLMIYIALLDPTLLTSDNYTLQVAISDNTTVSDVTCETSTTNVTIQVVQDLAPIFTQQSYNGTINERDPQGTPVVMVEAISRNDPGSSQIFYTLTKGDDKFQIDTKTGNITVRLPTTDYEIEDEYNLVVEAQDRGTEPFRIASVTVTVYVNDINDECPNFDQQLYTGQVTPQDRFVLDSGTVDRLVLTAIDLDSVFTGYSSKWNDTSDGGFDIVEDTSLDSTTSQIYVVVNDSTKFQLNQTYQLGILLTDTTVDTSCSSFTLVTISVEDLDPKFTEEIYTGEVDERADVGTPVGKVTAVNKDGTPDGIVYRILSGTGDWFSFTIDSTSGEITMASNTLDAEMAMGYTLFVEAQDTRTEIIRTATTKVIVTVNDLNDNCPEFTSLSYSGLLSSQDAFVVQADMSQRLILQALDLDVSIFIGNASVTTDNSGAGFELVETMATGEIGYYISVADFQALLPDSIHIIQVTLEDITNTYCSNTSVVNVIIEVRDLAPVFEPAEYNANVTENSYPDVEVVQVFALNYGGTSGGIVYSLKSASSNNGLEVFKIDSDSGFITTTNNATDREVYSEYTLVVEAQDRSLDPIRSTIARVFVSVNDENDKCPAFVDTGPIRAQVSKQDIFVLDATTLEPLVLQAIDGDLTFDGIASDDSIDGIFGLENTTDVNNLFLSIRLLDPDRLIGGDEYTLKVSVVDLSITGCIRSVDVMITASANDYLAPVFDLPSYEKFIPETTAPGTDVIQVTASSQNPNPEPGDIYYTLTEGSPMFSIDPSNGWISIENGSNYETQREYFLIVEAQDRGIEPPKSASTSVIILITDENDECPYFIENSYSGDISLEDVYVLLSGTSDRLLLVAMDEDSNFQGDVSITDGNPSDSFDVEEVMDSNSQTTSWYMKLLNPDGVIENMNYELMVTVRDSTPNASCDYGQNTTVSIAVLNLSPQFINDTYNAEVLESATPPTPVLTVSAVDYTDDPSPIAYYLNAASEGKDVFTIDSVSGLISVSGVLDAEMTTRYTLIVEAVDTNQDVLRSTTTSVVINVIDVNNNDPVFDPPAYSADVSEDALVNSFVINVKASDVDQNDILVYSIVDNVPDFAIDSETGFITVHGPLDRESTPTYSFQVSVSDGSNADTCTVDIDVLDVNDNPPVFTQDLYNSTIYENEPNATVMVSASDDDTGNNAMITFEILPPVYDVTVDGSGLMTFNGPFDRESTSVIEVTVRVIDDGQPAMSSTALVKLTILDVNDEAPVFDPNSCTFARLPEDFLPDPPSPTPIGCTVLAEDLDEPGSVNSEITYYVEGPDASYFDIIQDVDGYGQLWLMRELDSETQSVLDIIIEARDNGDPQNTATLDVTIEIEDVNDIAPTFAESEYNEVFPDETDELPAAYPVLSLTPSDGDVEDVHRFILCNITMDSLSKEYFSVSSDGTTCTLSTSRAVPVDLFDAYSVTLLAYNPDKESLKQPESEAVVNIFVGTVICVVDTDEPAYYERKNQGDVSSDPIVSIEATSPCVGDFGFEFLNQTLVEDGQATPIVSDDFRVDTAGGSTGQVISNVIPPSVGVHTLTINVYNGTKPDEYPTTVMVEITILPDSNQAPAFDNIPQPIIIHAPKLAGFPLLNLTAYASDPDSPMFGVGEIAFEEISERDDDGTDPMILNVDTDTGVVTLSQDLLDVTYSVYLNVSVFDFGIPSLDDTTVIMFTIKPPISFEPSSCNGAATVEENFTPAVICTVTALSDGAVTYSVEDETYFSIDSSSGEIRPKVEFDYEDPTQRQLVLVAVAEAGGLQTSQIITVTVTDINDNPPVFDMSGCFDEMSSPEVIENSPAETFVCRALATDLDAPGTDNSRVTYSLKGPDADLFNISTNGVISITGSIDREDPLDKIYMITVVASDNGQPMLDSNRSLDIIVIDVNDVAPEFTDPQHTIPYNETVPSGTEILVLSTEDPDLPPGDAVLCEIATGQDSFFFFVMSDGLNCKLYNKEALPDGRYTVSIVAYNVENAELESQPAVVTILVGAETCIIDIPDNDYTLTRKTGEVIMNVPVLDINATSTCDYADIEYDILSQTYKADTDTPPADSTEFNIDTTTGEISSPSGNSAPGIYTLTVVALNTTNAETLRDTAMVFITILPVVNNRPEFDKDMYDVTVVTPEKMDELVIDLSLYATDPDSPWIGVGEIEFEEVSENRGSDLFTVSSDGNVTLTEDLFIIEPAYIVDLEVKATDKGTPPLSDTAIVRITIEPPIPEFIPNPCPDPVEILEETMEPVPICNVTAIGGGEISYTLNVETYFTIGQTTGYIYTKEDAPLDYENPEQRNILLVVTASTADDRKATTTVNVNVLNVNDESPVFSESGCLDPETPPSILERSNPGTFVCRVFAEDADTDNSQITYSLEGPDSGLFDISTTGIISVSGVIDRDDPLDKIYTVAVVASDNGEPTQSTSAPFQITTIDVNDVAPEFTNIVTPVVYNETVPSGTEILVLSTEDTDDPPGDAVLCEIGTGQDRFYVMSDGINCTLTNKEALLNGRYTVSIIAYNVEKCQLEIGDCQSEPAEVTVLVGADNCYIDIPGNENRLTRKTDEVISGDPLIVINATSTCEGANGDIVFEILSETYQPDSNTPADNSTEFVINATNGEISSPTGSPQPGIYTLMVEAFNTSDPDTLRDTTMVFITILPAANSPPEFDSAAYFETLITPEKAGYQLLLDLSLYASDPNSPLIGVGEIEFRELSETRDGTGSNLFTVTLNGLIQLSVDLYEIEPLYTIDLEVEVSDKGAPPLSDTAIVRITIEPPIPEFIPGSCPDPVEILEETMEPVPICNVTAIGGGEISYTLNVETYFTIGQTTGYIYTKEDAPLDYENPEQRNILLVVTASTADDRKATTTLNVNVLNVNDESPVFSESGCLDQDTPPLILERSTPGTVVCRVFVEDADTDNSQVTYSLEGQDAGLFDISTTGIISVSGVIDRDDPLDKIYTVTVVASDNGVPTQSTSAPLRIATIDVNDVAPEFTNIVTPVVYNETVPSGTEILVLSTEDTDDPPGDAVLCEIGTGQDRFYVMSDGINCTLINKEGLLSGRYTVSIIAYNVEECQLEIGDCQSEPAEVTVLVGADNCYIDIPGNENKLTRKTDEVISGDPLIVINATSTCEGANGDIVFEILSETYQPDSNTPPDNSTEFVINATNGGISSPTGSPQPGIYTLMVVAFNTSDPDTLRDTTMVFITILPAANSPPEFDSAAYFETLITPEEAEYQLVLDLSLHASDPNSPLIGVGEIEFKKLSETRDGTGSDLFTVTLNGLIQLSVDLYEIEPLYTIDLEVEVSDKGVPPLSDTAIVRITVEPPIPEFIPGSCPGPVEIEEGIMDPTFICNVTAEGGGDIIYTLNDETYFTIEETTGYIYTKEDMPLNFEDPEQRNILLIATATAGDRKATTMVEVNVLDINDEPPMFVANECDNVILLENSIFETQVCRVLAFDMDAPDTDNSDITYELIGENKEKFDIRKDNDGYGIIYLNWSLDREVEPSLSFTILARDNGDPERNASLPVTITIGDINDNAPVFPILPIKVIFDQPVDSGVVVTSVTPVDNDAAPFDTSLCEVSSQNNDADMFYVSSDGTTCTLYTAKPIGLSSDSYTVTITAYNPDKPDLCNDTSACSIEVTVFVTDNTCFVDIQPGDYIVKSRPADVNTGVAVVTVMANSTCTENIVYNISSQEFSPYPGEPFVTSENFTIPDRLSSDIYPVTNTPTIGEHIMTVVAYHESDSDTSKDEVQVAITIVSDTNSPPEFDQAVYNVTLVSPIYPVNPPYIVILDLGDSVTDDDMGTIGNGELTFTQVATDPDDGLFVVTESGEVRLVNPLIENEEAYTVRIDVNVADNGLPPYNDDAVVQIHIKLPESAINPPVFEADDCDGVSIDEELPESTYICQVEATSTSGEDIQYELVDAEFFSIDDNGVITTTEALDYEVQQQFSIVVSASNMDGTTLKPVTVIVNDINDNRPQFDLDPYSFTIEEHDESSSPPCPPIAVGNVHATDDDTLPENADITYKLEGTVENFEIDENTGDIRTTNCIDRDTEYQDGQVIFNVIAENIGENPLQNSVQVTVHIADVNDNNPVFDPEKYVVSLELLEPGLTVAFVTATDQDQATDGVTNGEVYYLFSEEQPNEIVFEYFGIDTITKNKPFTGRLFTRNVEEFPIEPIEYMINVNVFDKGSPSRSDPEGALVRVLVGNLEEPYFKLVDRNQSLILEEEKSDVCANFTTPLYNETRAVEYKIISTTESPFEIKCVDHIYPQLCTKEELDREDQNTTGRYEVRIEAMYYPDKNEDRQCIVHEPVFNSAAYSNEVIQSNQTILLVLLSDVNDVFPEFKLPEYTREKLGYKYYIGVADDLMYDANVTHILASDPDLDYTLVFNITPNAEQTGACYDPPEFAINERGDLLLKDSLYTNPDRLTSARFTQEQASCDYTITVTDEAAEGMDQSTSIDAKIKTLLVYEHIIISLDEPPEQVKLEVAGIVSCLANVIPNYVLFVEDVRAYLREEIKYTSVIQPEWTDIWLYAVNTKTKEFAKFWEFEEAFFNSSEWKCCFNSSGWIDCVPDGADYLSMNLTMRRPSNIYYRDVSYAGFALLAVAGFIGLAGLLCMFALFLSWDRMQADKARKIAQEPDEEPDRGKVNLMYSPDSVPDLRADSIREPRLSIQDSAESVELTKIKLWETESQELTMDMFNETDDFSVDDDEVALIPPTSPTEAKILVDKDGEMAFVTESHDDDAKSEQSTDDVDDKSDSDEVKDRKEGDGEILASPTPVKGLVTFFEEPKESADNDETALPPPATPPPHPQIPTPPPPPPPPPQDEKKTPAVSKPVVFKSKEGETLEVVIPSTNV